MFLGEESDDVIGHDRTDILYSDQVSVRFGFVVLRGDHSVSQSFEIAVNARQSFCCGLADLTDSEGVDEAVKGDLAAFVNRGKQVAFGGFAPAFLRADGCQAVLIALLPV